jgi:hypothetical protein
MKVAHSLLVALAAHLAWGGSAFADDKWEVWRNKSSSACWVCRETCRPKLGDVVSKHETMLEACKAAKALYDSTAGDTNGKCWTYGQGTLTDCKAKGVELGK